MRALIQSNRATRLVTLAALAWLIALRASAAEATDAQFLDGLRQRQLFKLAEKYCADRLAGLPSDHTARAELTNELIRTYAMHAANAKPGERDVLWKTARKAADDLIKQRPPHPRAIFVRLQDALTPLAQGELGRQEFEAGALAEDEVEPIRQALREATSLLAAIDKELTRDVPLRRRTPPRGGEPTGDELFALQQHVQQQLARAQRNRALLFAAGSDDRLSQLIAAVETLQKPLAQLAPDDPLLPAMQLDLAECQRLLGKLDQAGELAWSLDRDDVTPLLRLRARAEQIRVAVAQKDVANIERLLAEGRELEGQSLAELDFAWFEGFLSLARSASDGQRLANPEKLLPAALAKRYQDQAATQAEFLEATYGPYWGRRADQLLVSALPRDAGSTANADLLSRKADSLYRKGEHDSALAAYDDAAAAARAKNDLQVAFELAYKAALVEQQRGRHSDAANRLRILAKSLATHKHAPQAHLLAAWNAAQLAQVDAATVDNYAAILREHMATFPRAKSVNQARLWLGQLHESRAAWPEAIEAYSGIARESEHFAAAIAALARCWPVHLAALSAAGQPTEGPAADAISFFTSAITDSEQNAALAAAELIVTWQPERAKEAETILQAALANSDDAPAEWRSAAQTQLVVVLAAQPDRQTEAVAVVQTIGAASNAQMLAVLSSLAQIAARATSQDQRREIAQVQLAATAALVPRRASLSKAEQLQFDRIQAEALAAAGRRQEALASYSTLARANPNGGAIQQGYAELLLDSTDPAELNQSLGQWRLVASRLKPRTADWFEAKYSIALAQFKLGDRAGAATLLKYMLETPPGLKGSEWEARYAELLGQCGE